MKAVILAGGLGTRLSEETYDKPKPMVEIGGKPILWHIMKIYASHGIKDFIICCGYKGYFIKEYFYNYALHNANIEFKLSENDFKLTNNNAEEWSVNCVDTGPETQTGGRLKRVEKYLTPGEKFLFTYGDGVCNINISDLITFHNQHGKQATVTATRPAGRYGALKISPNNSVTHFQEKPDGDGSWINGGFFVLSPSVIDQIKDDQTSWENEPLTNLARNNQLVAFKHNDFWMSMDTLRDKIILNKLWDDNKAPWKVW